MQYRKRANLVLTTDMDTFAIIDGVEYGRGVCDTVYVAIRPGIQIKFYNNKKKETALYKNGELVDIGTRIKMTIEDFGNRPCLTIEGGEDEHYGVVSIIEQDELKLEKAT